jgi:hypothetical protein
VTKRLATVTLIIAGTALCVGSFMAWDWFGPAPQLGAPTATYGMLAGGPITLAVGVFSVGVAIGFLKRGGSTKWAVGCVCALALGLLVSIRFLVEYSRVGFLPVHSLGGGLKVCLIASVVGVATSFYLLIRLRMDAERAEGTVAR